jgi:hypothetical protein
MKMRIWYLVLAAVALPATLNAEYRSIELGVRGMD